MRLSKIAKDFNVGIQTLVEFLEKKAGTAESWGPMSNVPDDLYEQMSREFNKDKSVKMASERERQERMQTRDKIKKETQQIQAVNRGETQSTKATTPGDNLAAQQQGPKVLGHIDLDALKKKPAAPEQKPQQPKQQAQQKPQQQKPQQAQQQKQQAQQHKICR